jgi:hypothetical protein
MMRMLFAVLIAVPLFAQVPMIHTIAVTNTNDDGSGSLRAAIDEANASCNGRDFCRIVFRIEGTQPWYTIRPTRPLPSLRVNNIQIDGASQEAFGGNRNPIGPEIELNGSLQPDGNGLHVQSCQSSVNGLAINGFAGNGVLIETRTCDPMSISGWLGANYIGTDPRGETAVPNTRGVWVESPAGALNFHTTIADNVISGNRRSGIFVASGPQKITRNIIGLNATHTAGLSNGASGVAVLVEGSGTDIDDNFIGFNHHFGVGLAQGTKKVSLSGNSFQANWQLAIDYGMDGVSPQGAVAIPEITRVTYADGVTTIEAVTDTRLGTFPRLFFYANDAPDPSGYGEGQYALGMSMLSGSEERTFVFRYPGDLRGKWVTATAMHVHYYGFLRDPGPGKNGEWQGFVTTSSEFSRAVEVK